MQVVGNLLGNAVKFTEAGVGLAARQRCRADDGGAGAVGTALRSKSRTPASASTPDRLARLFEPFEQGDASMTRRFGGTGLGLAISQRLAELMGGRLWAAQRAGPRVDLLRRAAARRRQ